MVIVLEGMLTILHSRLSQAVEYKRKQTMTREECAVHLNDVTCYKSVL